MDEDNTTTSPRRLTVDRSFDGRRRGPMRRILAGWLPVMLAFFALASWWSYQRVQSNVIDDATEQLAAAGFDQQLADNQLRLDARFRTISVSGALPADVDAAGIEALLLDLESVNKVELDLETLPPTPLPPTTSTTEAPPGPSTTEPTPSTTEPPPAADVLVITYADDIATISGPIGDLTFTQIVLNALGTNVETIDFTGLEVLADAQPPADPDRLTPLLLALPSAESARITLEDAALSVTAAAGSPLAAAQWNLLAEQAAASQTNISFDPTADGD